MALSISMMGHSTIALSYQTFIVTPNKYQKRMLMHLTIRISKMQYYMSLLLLLILTKMYYLGQVLRMW